MGFSGLVRWTNAPTTGLELIAQNILKNHQGQYKGKWHLSMKSFRSTLGPIPGYQVSVERSMCTLTMDDNVFCVLEDPAAPMRAEWLPQAQAFAKQGQTIPKPTHFRHTFPTLGPPGALEQLLTQLRARWVPVRHTSGAGGGGGGAGGTGSAPGQLLATGAHLTVEGHVYAIGSDWLVRAGNVIISPGGAMKGMLLEVEYVPLPVMEATYAMQPVLTNLLLSILPNLPDPKIVAMTLGDEQWAEVETGDDLGMATDPKTDEDDEDDIYAAEDDHPSYKQGDWMGIERDRRSAYLIIGALKQEGLL
ncbi:hypothetical protein C8Q80DRAFT_1349282 [Daedaleopsis nitida]|nr:hypothetical protein C8Q80DRAFT_1349282 [Daedaleopsis nitida]